MCVGALSLDVMSGDAIHELIGPARLRVFASEVFDRKVVRVTEAFAVGDDGSLQIPHG